MPDKNSLNEVCYVCGDEQKRGSLIEICSVEPKDVRDRNKPYFPIFNETHPRPARSRPKDPRGTIQACALCHDHLMKQWHYFLVNDVPDGKRLYKLRPTLSTGRTTFVCYTCGNETLSTNLMLVYCCQNAENEPFYPFIKTMKPYPNASPISPQGMLIGYDHQVTIPKNHLFYVAPYRHISTNLHFLICRNGANMFRVQ